MDDRFGYLIYNKKLNIDMFVDKPAKDVIYLADEVSQYLRNVCTEELEDKE
jgi:hypothetical protein